MSLNSKKICFSLVLAAAAGGYTTCIEMPQSIPPVVNKEAFLLKKKLATEKAVVDFALWGGLVPSSLDKIKELKQYAESHNIDLLAFVSKQRNFWEKLIHKSVTENVALSSDIPMMVVHLHDKV